tara:strand:+ start:2338 stop:2841 length:504 start_codon:yes stop_codon:yes gene_type:complete
MPLYEVNEKLVLKEIKKLQPLNYNRFRWWRRFTSKTQPLHKNSDLLPKIQNGDYEFSQYYWQAKYTELEINKIYDECYPDFSKFNEKNAVNGVRRKRLLSDFEKDENDRLNQIPKDFYIHFKMTKTQVKEEMEEFGNSLEKFYIYCEKKFGKRNKPMSTRGRPKKIK